MSPMMALLDRGGLVIWVILALSVIGLGVILWKLWHLSIMGACGGARAERAVTDFCKNGTLPNHSGGGIRMAVSRTAMTSLVDAGLTVEQAREETERVARRALYEARRGLRVLDTISTIAPLLGLLGNDLERAGGHRNGVDLSPEQLLSRTCA